MADLPKTWSHRWPDRLWLQRFRRRCLRDIRNGVRVPAPASSPADVRLVPPAIPRQIWIYWFRGWRDAPPLVRACRESWIKNNPDWKVNFLDGETQGHYADLGDLLSDKKISPTERSELVRLSLLTSYGGVWVDATTFCSMPLSGWLPHLLQSGFFAFSRPGTDRLLATWFIASEPRGHLVERWQQLAHRYWRLIDEPDHYYWLHYLFAECVRSDAKARWLWQATPQVSADAPREVMRRAVETEGIDDILALVTEPRVFVHKLDWRLAKPTGAERTPLGTLLEEDNWQQKWLGVSPATEPPATPMLRVSMEPSAKLYSLPALRGFSRTAKKLQADKGSRDAVSYLLRQLGFDVTVDHDEHYCTEALNYHLGVLEAYAARPDAMAEHIKLSRTTPGPDDEVLFSGHVSGSIWAAAAAV